MRIKLSIILCIHTYVVYTVCILLVLYTCSTLVLYELVVCMLSYAYESIL